MDTSTLRLSYDSTVGAGQDHSSEADTAVIRPPENDPLGAGGPALPPKAKAFIAGCEPNEAEHCLTSALRILGNEQQTVVGRIDTGLELIERKRELGHGRYLAYVGSLDISEKHAERCTNVALHFNPHRNLVSGTAWSALCEVAAKGVPDEVRDEVIVRLKAGEYLTRKDIRDLIESASGTTSRPATKIGRPGLPQTAPSHSEKRPDSLTAVPDRLRAVASLVRSDSSVAGEANEFAVTLPEMQPSRDQPPTLAQPTTRAVELLPAPQMKTMPSQEQVDVPTVMHKDLPALASLMQPDGAVAGDMTEKATSTSGRHMPDGRESCTAMSAGQAVDLLSGKVTREEALELYYCWKGTFGEFMRLFGQRYGLAEADARVMDDECGNRAEVS